MSTPRAEPGLDCPLELLALYSLAYENMRYRSRESKELDDLITAAQLGDDED